MNARCILRVAAAFTMASALVSIARAADGPAEIASSELSFGVSEHVLADIDADGRSEVVLVGDDGRVVVQGLDAEGRLRERSVGDTDQLVLPHPRRTIFAITDLTGAGAGLHLVALSPDGVRAYPAIPGGGFSKRAIEPEGRMRFVLRVGTPRRAEIVRDLNHDGRPDLVVPRSDSCEIWLQEPGDGAGPPRFVRAAEVQLDVKDTTTAEAGALTDVLESAFRVPNLSIEDVNGDEREDLLVVDGKVRAFHLQREDGTIPAEADVRVDLDLFRDTTPEADVRLGRTLAGGDSQRYESRDLDGDGIPDHVIAHRRKVWVFRGGPEGPQFAEPTAILKTAEDVTALLLVRVDPDDRPDLVLVRVQVPSAAGLLRGLLAEWDIELAAVGYRGLGVKGFETAPEWRGELTVRLPALLGVIRNPDALLRKLEDVSNRFDESLEADLDGDGGADVAMIGRGDHDVLRIWLGAAAGADAKDAERILGRVLFEDEDRTWTLDRLLGWLGSMAERRAQRLTGGRAADHELRLRGKDHERRGVETADLNGDGRSEVVVAYERESDGVFVLDVLGWR